MTSRKDIEYDVALSYAGEDRDYVEKVASSLREKGVRVFYDEYERVMLWGKNLYEHLQDVYENKARFTVAFISSHYVKKPWANHEMQSAQARAFRENQEYILPVRFDETEIPGLLKTVAYISLKDLASDELAELIREKLSQTHKGKEPPDGNGTSIPPPDPPKTGPFFRPRLSWIHVNSPSLERVAKLVRFLLHIYLVGFVAYIGLKLLTTFIDDMELGDVWSTFFDPHFLRSFIVALFGYALFKLMEAELLNRQIFLSLLLGFALLALAFLSCALVLFVTEWQPAHIGVIGVVSIVFLILFLNYSNIFFYLRKRSYGDAVLEFLVAIIFLVMYFMIVLEPVRRFMNE